MGQKNRKLPEAVLVHCTDVHVLLERLRGEKSFIWEWCIVGKRFRKFTLILFEYILYASSPEPSAYVLQNRGGRKTAPLGVCQAAESHHILQKGWSTLKLDELPYL